MCKGWVKIHRALAEWEWASDPNMVSLLIHLLIAANHKDKKWKGITLKPGQLIFGREEWSVKTGISVQTIRTCITRLKSTSEITIKSTSKYSVLTIVKWEEYQCSDNESTSKSTSKLTNNQPATNHTLRMKELKKELKEKNKQKRKTEIEVKQPNQFDDFWNEYPSVGVPKGSKQDAIKKFNKLILEGVNYEKIIGGVRDYAEYARGTGSYTKHAVTWLNARGWEDDYSFTAAHKPNGSDATIDAFSRVLSRM